MTIPSVSSHRRRRPDAASVSALLLVLTTAGAAAADGEHPAHAARVLAGLEDGDVAAATATLREAADRGDARSARWLGDAAFLGRGVPRDSGRAVTWWRRAAGLGDSRAAYNAGLVLWREPAHREDGRALLARAADDGEALACFILGTAAAADGNGEQGRAWLECAARQGYAPAQYNLAQLLRRDSATPPDAARAWYAAAAPSFAPAAAALAALDARGDDAAPPVHAADDAGVAVAAPTPAASAADRPTIHDRDWVLARDDDAYTIQVGAGSDAAALARLLERCAGALPAARFVHRPGAREPYTAIIGVFTAYTDATAALAALPPELDGNAPWVRRFGMLKAELRAGDASRSPAPIEPP